MDEMFKSILWNKTNIFKTNLTKNLNLLIKSNHNLYRVKHLLE